MASSGFLHILMMAYRAAKRRSSLQSRMLHLMPAALTTLPSFSRETMVEKETFDLAKRDGTACRVAHRMGLWSEVVCWVQYLL